VRVEKEIKKGEIVFRKVREKRSRGGTVREVDEVFRFKMPQSTYVDWWLKYLEQEIEELTQRVRKLEEALRR